MALCLTVYEAKGLEFDDVILYNFFHDSPAANMWWLIGDIQVSTKQRKKLKFEDALTLNELDFEEYAKFIKKMEQNLINEEDIEYEDYTDFNLLWERNEIYW